MFKPLVIPDKCPTCSSEVDVDKFLKGWTIVRCINKNCNWWNRGYIDDDH